MLQKTIFKKSTFCNFSRFLGLTSDGNKPKFISAQLSVLVFAVVVIDTDVDADDASDSNVIADFNANPEVSVDADADAGAELRGC